jgi:hypothetical protein
VPLSHYLPSDKSCEGFHNSKVGCFGAFCQYREASALGKHVRKVSGKRSHHSVEPLSSSGDENDPRPKGKMMVTTIRAKGKRLDRVGNLLPCSLIVTRLYPAEKVRRRHPWTRTHSFYALMGGFAIDTRRCERKFHSHNRNRMILNLEGFKCLLQHEPDFLQEISLEEIQDKSKASNIAKTIVCCQAIWFCGQCGARWYSNLGFSLLELNKFAHCLCALIIFIMWWNKPLDVESPTLIDANSMLELAAFVAI